MSRNSPVANNNAITAIARRSPTLTLCVHVVTACTAAVLSGRPNVIKTLTYLYCFRRKIQKLGRVAEAECRPTRQPSLQCTLSISMFYK